jgi:L-lactate dehydrogenase complex protein LldG
MVGRTGKEHAVMSAAKDDMLARIRKSLGGSTPPDSGYRSTMPRNFRHAAALDPEERIHLFVDRLHDYGAAVYRTEAAAIPDAVRQALNAQNKKTLLIPEKLPAEWLPADLFFHADKNLTYAEIDRSEGVLTGCAVAIALSGTIVLRHSPGEGRRALTLIPDYHLCVVFEEQVVETVPEAISRMSAFSTLPLTTISGPSATSDIEMTRVKGVHGPRTLEVILVR